MLGFPTETQQEMQDTATFALKLKGVNEIGVHPTVPLPGSGIWQTAIEEAKILPDLIDRYIRGELGEGFRKRWPRYVPDCATHQDVMRFRNMAYRRFYFRPAYVFKRFLKDMKSPEALRRDLREACSLFLTGRSSWGD